MKLEILFGEAGEEKVISCYTCGEGGVIGSHLYQLELTAHTLYLNTYKPDLCLNRLEIVVQQGRWWLEKRRFT